MSAAIEEPRVHAVALAARQASAPALTPERRREMVQTALLAGAAEPQGRWPAPSVLVAAAVVLLALGTGAYLAFGTSLGSFGSSAELLVLTLPTGDRVRATEGSRFRFEELEATTRRVALDEGVMVFDVAPLEDGGRFEVATADLEVAVVGTVFEVRADDAGTAIHVYEGRVEVRRGAQRRVLGAGETFSIGHPPSRDVRIARVGREAARLRAARVTRSRRVVDEPGPGPVEVEARVEVADDLDTPAPTVTGRAPSQGPVLPAEDLPAIHSPQELRSMIAAGDAAQALDLARQARRAVDRKGRYWIVEGDALRALGRMAPAVAAYDRGAALSGGAARATAGYRAASLRAHELDDLEGALTSLDVADVDARGSALEERGLALRIRCLVRLGWNEAARMRAHTYLRRFPRGSLAGWMREMVGQRP